MRRTATASALLALVTLTILLPPAVRAADEPPTRDILWTEKKLYSYGNEELIVRDFFQDRRDGVFVEIGCAWPIKNSNTYYLEHHLGWGGIGVDGLPDFAPSWKESRPRSVFLNFLVTERSDELEKFYKVGVWGLSTAEKDLAKDLTVVGEIQVPGITLDDLLARQGVTELDFLSIDVEGHQQEVLAGFDVQRWKPKLVCIEDDGPLSVAWFKERGYEPIERYRFRDVVNWWFAPKDEARAANARQTERGREEARKRAELLAKEPPDSPARVYMTPKYLLGPDGNTMQNPAWHPSAEPHGHLAAAAAGASRAADSPSPSGASAAPVAAASAGPGGASAAAPTVAPAER